MAIKGFEILLWFLIIPLAAGNLPVFETGKEKDWFVRMADALICGYVLLFAVFELLALPLIFTRQSFAVLKYSYEILACVLALAGVIFAWKNKKNRKPLIIDWCNLSIFILTEIGFHSVEDS